MSHVAMGKHLCKVCGIKFDSGEVLLHKNLRDIDPKKTLTGWGLCREHEKLFNDGYLAIVEADEKKSSFLDNGNMSPEGAYRTGRIIHMRRHVVKQVFNVDIKPSQDMVFIDIEAFDTVKDMMNLQEKEEASDVASKA